MILLHTVKNEGGLIFPDEAHHSPDVPPYSKITLGRGEGGGAEEREGEGEINEERREVGGE